MVSGCLVMPVSLAVLGKVISKVCFSTKYGVSATAESTYLKAYFSLSEADSG